MTETWEEKQKRKREERRCPHCHSLETRSDCRKCNRQMCQECISLWPGFGVVCGLCWDRMEGRARWEKKFAGHPNPPDFDEWYDQNG